MGNHTLDRLTQHLELSKKISCPQHLDRGALHEVCVWDLDRSGASQYIVGLLLVSCN